jgi:hypothetical protein
MSIPVGTKFIGIAADVDTYERKSAQANSPSNVYTIEEIKDGGVPDSRTITINGTTSDLTANRTYTVTDANLSTSDITTNNVSTSKHGFVPKASTINGSFLEVSGTSTVWTNIVYTIELINALTVDFYAPYNLKINSVSNVLNSPTTTILDDGASYTVGGGATIASGSKVTITVNTAAVVNLNIEKA